MINFSKFIENRIKNIQATDSFAFATAIGVGPWLVPLGPAIIFGYALYVSAPPNMADFRIMTAVAVAIGLIVAGAISSHNAITSPGWKAWSLVAGYIFLEIVGLWAMSVSFDVKVVGTVASLLTLIVYLSRSSAKEIDLDRSEAAQAAKAKMDFQLEQARLNAEHKRVMATKAADLKHTEKLAKIEAQSVSQVSVPLTVRNTVHEQSANKTLEILKSDIIAELRQDKPNMTKLAHQLDIGRTTLYKHLRTLAEQGEVIKNGNGYEPTNS